MRWDRGRRVLLAALCACLIPSAASAATINVTTVADELDATPDAKCSLREAVESANTNTAVGGCKKGSGASDTIALRQRAYELTIPSTNEDFNQNGDLDVTGPVTITGDDQKTSIDAGDFDRLIDVLGDDYLVTLKSLQLFGGDVTGEGTSLDGRGGNLRSVDGASITLDRAGILNGNAFTGGGVYMRSASGLASLKISRSGFVQNEATGLGGALDVDADVKTTISKSKFRENTVADDGSSADAGAISQRSTQMTIADTNFANNKALGGVNQAAAGGAIYVSGNSGLTVRRSLFRGNSADAPTAGFFEGGGAVFTGSGTAPVSITNSTFYENTVGSPSGSGSAVYVNSGTTILGNVTVSASGPSSLLQAPAGYLQFRSSILQGSEPCGGADTSIDSGGYNVTASGDAECSFNSTDLTDIASFGFVDNAPKSNGGSTGTIALKKSSPAVDLIPKSACGIAEGKDQRGYKRPKSKCDAGAYERGAKKPKRK